MTEPVVQTGLAAWLLACIDEEDGKVRDPRRPSILGLPRKWIGRVWLPNKIRDECTAKRRIVKLHSSLHTVVDGFCVEEGGECTHAGESDCTLCGQEPCQTLRLLALSVANHHDGYRGDLWAPDGR